MVSFKLSFGKVAGCLQIRHDANFVLCPLLLEHSAVSYTFPFFVDCIKEVKGLT
jgi:hypothetical protein